MTRPIGGAAARSRFDLALRIALCASAAVGLWLGWRTFWFQCDDAFIAYRYVSNSVLGRGYTWNPPPFRPVEGYTSFLWVVLLDGVWRVFGAPPPRSANWLSLGFSAASLALVVTLVLRLRLSPGLARWRTALLALVLFGVLTNRTFLAWTSSGLETALFGLLLLAWVVLGWRSASHDRARVGFAAAAGVLALTRPDGLLFAAVTAAVLVAHALAGASPRRRIAFAAAPLLLPVVHVAWRRATYGFWLPNTFYVKQGEPWPEAGARYLASFLLEYGYWVWLGVVAVAAWRAWREGSLAARLRAGDAETLTRAAVCAALALHVAYYTVLIGGDHFEFRVYQHLVPLVLVSFASVAERAGLSPRGALGTLALMLAIGLPLPWLHWWHTHELHRRSETFVLRYSVAPHLPGLVRGYGAAFDQLQSWLIEHGIGVRHQEHKIFALRQQLVLPTRAVGAEITEAQRAVFPYAVVGVAGWVLPHVVIIDYLGLNDTVIAHWPRPPEPEETRTMAHDLAPPPGYLDCFRPNVTFEYDRRVQVEPRVLTDEEIRRCEETFLEGARG
jgi:arabinofuranosyltransferase